MSIDPMPSMVGREEDPPSSSGSETIIEVAHWLGAAVSPTMLFVYRSVQLHDDDPLLRPVWALVGETKPLVHVTIPDADMFGAHGEWSCYPLSN